MWVLNFIRPPEDATWKEVNRWRWNVCVTLAILVAAVAWGYKQVAWASDVDRKIETVIEKKIEPIVAEQQRQRVVLDRVNQLLVDNLAQSKAAEIRLVIVKRCKAQAFAERDALIVEKDRLQAQYYALKGERYNEPTCGEL